MADEPHDLMLEHLRAIREEPSGVSRRPETLESKVDDNTHAMSGLTMMLTMPAGHVHHMDERLEAVEAKLGA